MDLSPKWIIENNRIILGKVSFHHQLSEYSALTIEQQAKNIAGGGWFSYLEEDNSFLFYALSTDFGQCTLEQVQAAYQNGVDVMHYDDDRYSDHPIRFSTCLKLEDALNNNILLTK